MGVLDLRAIDDDYRSSRSDGLQSSKRCGDGAVLFPDRCPTCTAFDRWRLVYEVDDENTIVGGIRTLF